MGLNITLFTFGDRVDFGLQVDPDLIGDPWAIADALHWQRTTVQQIKQQAREQGLEVRR